MSKKRRKEKKRRQPPVKARRTMTTEQSARLQRAAHAQSTGNLALAEAEYRALIAEKARSPQLYCNLAMICARSARREEAIKLWKNALGIDPRFLEARMNLADSYQQAGELERAITAYERIVSDNQKFVAARYLLANILKSQGKHKQARDHYRQIMQQQPDYTQAHFTFSGVHKYKDRSDPHIGTMLSLYQDEKLPAEGKIHLAFALAKAFEDIQDYPQAFEYLETGNGLRAGQFHYDIEADKMLMESIIRSFTREAISGLQVSPPDSNKPIFIVGMPRSGTSLVEKIIASHSDVYGAGELDYMFALGSGLFLKESVDYQFRSLASYPQDIFAAVGEQYLEMINQLDTEAPRITDKMPLNLMMIGLIRLALPNAKIIHCVRDAKDTCLSIYKQNFTTANYRFAYDLKAVARFHNQYRRLMQHWHQVMPGQIYDVCYESLTQDPEHEIRKLLAGCDLEFQESCVDFSKSKGIVKTASAYQVRQPMYTSSVKLWEKYREFLGPMFEELDED